MIRFIARERYSGPKERIVTFDDVKALEKFLRAKSEMTRELVGIELIEDTKQKLEKWIKEKGEKNDRDNGTG